MPQPQNESDIRKLKIIFRWCIGVLVGTYLALTLLLNIPAVQRWVASVVGNVLSDVVQSEVEVGRVQVAWNGRLILDDVHIDDQQQRPMLQVTRMSARVRFLEIPQHRIRIDHAQLFGFHAHLLQEHPDSATNFQFFIDAFKSKKKSNKPKHPLDLRIGQVLIRRGHITWDQTWKPKTPNRLCPAHLAIDDLTVTAQLDALRPDSINLDVRRLSLTEQSGASIRDMAFLLTGNDQGAKLEHLRLELPNSSLVIPQLTTSWSALPLKKLPQGWLESMKWQGEMQAAILPQDILPYLPKGKIHLEALPEITLQLAGQGQGDNLRVSDLKVQVEPEVLDAHLSASISNLTKGKQDIGAEATIHELSVTNKTLAVVQQVLGKEPKENALLTKLGNIQTQGTLAWHNEQASGDLEVSALPGILHVSGKGTPKGNINLSAETKGFHVDQLFDTGKSPVGLVSLQMHAQGDVRGNDGRPALQVEGQIGQLELRNYIYRNIIVNGLCAGKRYSGRVSIEDLHLALDAHGTIDLEHPMVDLTGNVAHIEPYDLNLTKRFSDTSFSGALRVDMAGATLENMGGFARIDGFQMAHEDNIYRPGDLHIASYPQDDERHLVITSPFVEGRIDGQFNPKTLIAQFKEAIQGALMQEPTDQTTPTSNDHCNLVLNVYNPALLDSLMGIHLQLASPLQVAGSIDAAAQMVSLTASTEGLKYQKEDLRNIDLRVESNPKRLLGTLMLQRMMKGRPVDFQVETETRNQRLFTTLRWDNRLPQPQYRGDIHLTSRFWKDLEGRQAVQCDFQPSDFLISDTTWHMHPGSLTYQGNVLRVDSFAVSSLDRSLAVDGRASKSEQDTLHAHLQHIRLDYIFNLINLRAVEFMGEATGHAYARTLFSQPYADARLHIDNFGLNGGKFGDVDATLNWGRVEKTISIEAAIQDPEHNSRGLVQGTICPIKGATNGLDLNIQAQRINIFFLNKFTAAIFDRLEGRASGWARLYGPFKSLNVEGDINVDEASVGIPMIGVRYHLENDSVRLRPDNIYFDSARIYDPQGHPGSTQHSALVSGHLHHENFSRMTYDIELQGDNILGYDFRDFGDMPFYGTVWADGKVHLQGGPKQLTIDIEGAPTTGTTLTYNVTTPESITSSPFMTYVDRSAPRDTTTLTVNRTSLHDNEMDIRINFDLDIDPQAQMRLLMDPKAGDYITAYGRGRILAHYYNKGAFQLYGTYHLDHGTYKLSLQEVVRKDFQIQQGGTIVFGGNPMDADINVQAIYVVPSVSLNDISAKASFSNSNTRVNCLMNITGQAKAPRIAFDFDLPNVNDDEKQMVRSLISTDEERNMQVIYLLGIGRFYNPNSTMDTQQSATAMNSLLSSTLSGQINHVLNNMVGSSNWNFGANLSTGQTGWSDMDVEGLLSGRLLNNRLLINGNFGYRDNPVATSNFIGDFDVQYLLTPSGTVALKAYSETNDRYFTKSSLTTQGIGILLKKDFTRWRNLFRKK